MALWRTDNPIVEVLIVYEYVRSCWFHVKQALRKISDLVVQSLIMLIQQFPLIFTISLIRITKDVALNV